MKTFDWTSFTRKIAIKAPLADMYAAWTRSVYIQKWFLRKAEFFDGSNNLIPENQSVKEGGRYAWTWYLYEPTEYGNITAANGTDYLQFTFAGDCLVDIELEKQGEYTIVKLTQHHIPVDDASKRSIRLGCDTGWSFYLTNLKSVYEGGIDLRNKDPELKGMLNM